MPLVTTVTRVKAKTGCVDELVDALRGSDNVNSVSLCNLISSKVMQVFLLLPKQC